MPAGEAVTPLPGSRVYGSRIRGQVRVPVWNGNRHYVCAPLGAEIHARHPHGIDLDRKRGLVYQVIEHSGLRWNARRNGFEVAETTYEESGMLLVYDMKRPWQPRIVDGFLLGHGAHEAAVNERNGKVFQGNHEDSPGVEPNIWVDVIDTGFYNAVQGIEVDESLNQVFGTTHVGERMFAFDSGCVFKRNSPPTVVDCNGAPFVEKAQGENCIAYSFELRQPFIDQVTDAGEILALADSDLGDGTTVLPSVLHMHDLTVDPVNHRAYQTLHSIHHAEHSGSPEEAALDDPVEGGDTEPAHHFMGRWVAAVNVDPRSRKFQRVTYIDLSNGYGPLEYPNAEDVPADELLASFVRAHWAAADPRRGTVLVTGEHTGNPGVVEAERHDFELEQVVPISISIAACEPPVDETGAPEAPEPHVHRVQVNRRTGVVYVSDEGEGCYYDSVTILRP